MEEIVYYASDCSGMTENDVRVYAKFMKDTTSFFVFENWCPIEDFLDPECFFRLKNEFGEGNSVDDKI
jgi:hypothetical protein